MTKPRKELVSIDDTAYYHVVSRCVRRTFLCGFDKATQTSYDHRKQWIEDRIHLLSRLFSINLCSYAVMSNHYHLVVHLDQDQSRTWSNTEVAERWTSLFKGPLLIQQWLAGNQLTAEQIKTINTTLDVWRKRLASLSWFMKCLNEPIARQANKEDKCTGHFWESRFKSQALRTDDALLSCMAYVDLNPIRANRAQTPETSGHTSIKERINPSWRINKAIKQQNLESHAFLNTTPDNSTLMPFHSKHTQGQPHIPFKLQDYCELLDWTGRIIRDDKRGHISHDTKPILQRLDMQANVWLQLTKQFEVQYHACFGKRLKQSSG